MKFSIADIHLVSFLFSLLFGLASDSAWFAVSFVSLAFWFLIKMLEEDDDE